MFYMFKFVGGGVKKVFFYFEKVKLFYLNYDKKNVMILLWGEEMIDYFIVECKKEIDK